MQPSYETLNLFIVTLAQGHFCNLNTALNHIESNPMCLTALFLKDNNKYKINVY